MNGIGVKNGLVSYYGNIAGYVEDGTAIVDPMFQSDELAAYLTEKQNLAVEWRSGVFDRLATGSKTDMETGERQRLKDVRVWQLKPEADLMIRFVGYDDLIGGGYGEPDPDNYRVVYDGQLDTNDLEEIYTKFNIDHPQGFEGHSLSMSDVIELYDGSGSEFYYVDRFGFKEIGFESPQQEQINDQTMQF